MAALVRKCILIGTPKLLLGYVTHETSALSSKYAITTLTNMCNRNQNGTCASRTICYQIAVSLYPELGASSNTQSNEVIFHVLDEQQLTVHLPKRLPAVHHPKRAIIYDWYFLEGRASILLLFYLLLVFFFQYLGVMWDFTHSVDLCSFRRSRKFGKFSAVLDIYSITNLFVLMILVQFVERERETGLKLRRIKNPEPERYN